jgi:hypothetical protein
MLGKVIFHTIADADRENGLHIFRLEQAANNINILVPGTRIQQVGHERGRSAASQRPRLAGVTRRDPGVTPYPDIGAITHTPNETLLEKRHTLQDAASGVRHARGRHSVKDITIREVFGPNNSRTKRIGILDQSPTLLGKHCPVEQVQIKQTQATLTFALDRNFQLSQ